MKALKLISVSLLALFAVSCAMDSGETVGTLGTITANADKLIKGRTITFSVPIVTPIKGDVYSKDVIWAVNENSIPAKNPREVDGVYYMDYTPTTAGDVEVSITVSVVFSRVEGNTPIEQKTSTSAKFTIIDSQVHAFFWGDSQQTVTNTIEGTPVQEGNNLVYKEIESEYWGLSLVAPAINATYTFGTDGLSKVTETFFRTYADAGRRPYQRFAYDYNRTYEALKGYFEMSASVAIWNKGDLEASYSEAITAFIEKGYLGIGDEQREKVGEALYNNWVELTAKTKNSNVTTAAVFQAKGSTTDGGVTYTLILTPGNQ